MKRQRVCLFVSVTSPLGLGHLMVYVSPSFTSPLGAGYLMVYVSPSFTSSLGVGYLMVCSESYPSVLAFCFLDELQREFIVTYDTKRINSAVRPYSFIEFGERSCQLHTNLTSVNYHLPKN